MVHGKVQGNAENKIIKHNMKATLEDLKRELWFRLRENKSIVWVTKDGREIPINELSDTHLLNIITILKGKQTISEQEIKSECLNG